MNEDLEPARSLPDTGLPAREQSTASSSHPGRASTSLGSAGQVEFILGNLLADLKTSGRRVSRKFCWTTGAPCSLPFFLEAFPPVVRAPWLRLPAAAGELMAHQVIDRHNLTTRSGTSKQRECKLAEFHPVTARTIPPFLDITLVQTPKFRIECCPKGNPPVFLDAQGRLSACEQDAASSSRPWGNCKLVHTRPGGRKCFFLSMPCPLSVCSAFPSGGQPEWESGLSFLKLRPAPLPS